MLMGALIIAVIIGLAKGGSLKNLAGLNIRYVYLIFLAFAIQAGINLTAARYPGGGYPYLHIFSYLLLFFAMAKNRNLPGLYFMLAGTALNFAVIAVNGGQMPVSGDILPRDIVDVLASGRGGTHGLLTADTKLRFLADIIYLPTPFGKQMISVGDIFLDVGLLVLVVKGMTARPQTYQP